MQYAYLLKLKFKQIYRLLKSTGYFYAVLLSILVVILFFGVNAMPSNYSLAFFISIISIIHYNYKRNDLVFLQKLPISVPKLLFLEYSLLFSLLAIPLVFKRAFLHLTIGYIFNVIIAHWDKSTSSKYQKTMLLPILPYQLFEWKSTIRK